MEHGQAGPVSGPRATMTRHRTTLETLVSHLARSLPLGSTLIVEADAERVASSATGELLPVQGPPGPYRLRLQTQGQEVGWLELRSEQSPRLDTLQQVEDMAGILEAYLRTTAQERLLTYRVRQLERERLYDPLTGAASRVLLGDRIRRAQAIARRESLLTGLIFIDVDAFKAFNDTYGHLAGDRMLIELASRLAAAVRPADTVARLGGDEFVVVCEGLNSASELAQVADRIVGLAARPVRIEGSARSQSISLSAGLALVEPSEAIDPALERADAAMYRAKRSGGGRCAHSVGTSPDALMSQGHRSPTQADVASTVGSDPARS